MEEKSLSRKGERGNVLFLILIAVALFAALSYAVTQSTRSGGGSTEREKSILSGASMTQHPTALRTSIIRMILGGIDITSLEFNSPSTITATDKTKSVFHPDGGGALFQSAPADLMVSNSAGNWFYNINWQVQDIGITDNSDILGNDLVAFLPGISSAVCKQTNAEFGISTTGCTLSNGIPLLDTTSTDSEIREYMDDSYTVPADDELLQGDGCTAFSGQASGCFYYDNAGTNEYVFYSVLLER